MKRELEPFYKQEKFSSLSRASGNSWKKIKLLYRQYDDRSNAAYLEYCCSRLYTSLSLASNETK